jgi:hypothetical protein
MNVTTTTLLVKQDRYGEIVAHVWSPFQAKDVIKYSVPSNFRSWDAQAKAWLITGDIFIYSLIKDLRGQRFTVNVIDPSGFMQRLEDDLKARAKAAATPTATAVPSWADAMFEAIPEELHASVFKALLRALHPDRGGDTASMQTLNAARDRLASK